MTRIRRGNYIFVTWKGDHPPHHVHVYRDRDLVLKWNLVAGVVLEGKASSRLLRLIRELRREGRL